MRNGTKMKLFVSLLAAVLVLNVAAFAQGGDDVGMVFDFVEAPNELEEDVSVELDFSDELQLGDEVSSEEVELMAAEKGQAVEPGTVIEYDGLTYSIESNAQNMFTIKTNVAFDGKFSDSSIVASGNRDDTDGTLITTNGSRIITNDGHDDPGCLEFSSGILIWRCGSGTFSTDKYYVFSGWYKFLNGANINDDQRHVAGATDVRTGGTHYTEIGDSIEATGDWQQDLYVFKGSGDNKFLYLEFNSNSGSIRIDDFKIYEVTRNEPFTIDGTPIIEDVETWDTWEGDQLSIPEAGKKYNFNIQYLAKATRSQELNLVFVLFKDNALYDIISGEADTRTAILNNGTLIPGQGAVSVEFEVPEGEDISRFSCIGYLCDKNDPFNIYGTANEDYAVFINGAQQ